MLCLDRVQPAVAIQAPGGAGPVQRDPFCPFEGRIAYPAGSDDPARAISVRFVLSDSLLAGSVVRERLALSPVAELLGRLADR